MSRLLPFIAIIFIIGTVLVYIRPTFAGSIHDTRQQIDSYDSALEAAQRFQSKETQLTQARAQIPADSLSRLNSFLPDGVDNVQLILDMDALAARSGITLSEFDIQNDSSSATTDAASGSAPATIPSTDASTGSPALSLTSTSPIESLNLTFKATGTYSAFRTFLGAIENSLRPLDVINLKLTQAPNGVYTYGVTVRIYWLR